MPIKLIVQTSFGDYERGDEITNAQEIDRVLESHPHFVTAVATRDPVKPHIDAPLVDPGK